MTCGLGQTFTFSFLPPGVLYQSVGALLELASQDSGDSRSLNNASGLSSGSFCFGTKSFDALETSSRRRPMPLACPVDHSALGYTAMPKSQ